MSGRIGYGFFFVLAVTALIVFFNLGTVPLLDPDEPVYAETAKEMMLFNDFLSPRIYGEYWYDKPPMYYWLVAGAFKLFGVNEFAARFPSAALAVLCVLYVYYAGTKLFGERSGMVGALVLSTSVEFFYLAKAAVTDITLLFFLTVGLLAFLRKNYSLFYICTGLAVVTKGPVGFLFPAAIIFFYMLLGRRFSLLREMKIPLGIVLFSLTALPWYIYMYQHHGSAFIDTFLGFHNITRFTSPEHPEGILWYYFIPVLIIGFLPWTAVMVQAVGKIFTDSREHYQSLLFMTIWAAFIFLFFTASRTKLVSYILPMYPPLAMIVGWYISRIWDERRASRHLAWPALLTVLAGIFCAALVLAAQKMPELMPGVIAGVGIFVVMIMGVWYFVYRRDINRAFWLQVMAMTAFSLVLLSVLFPQAAPAFHSRDIAKAFTSHYDGKSQVYVVKFLRPGFAFYSGIYGTELKTGDWEKTLATPGKAYFVVRKPDFEKINVADRQKLNVLASADEKLLLLKP